MECTMDSTLINIVATPVVNTVRNTPLKLNPHKTNFIIIKEFLCH